MKKRTIWFIMLSFFALTLILNIGLKKSVIQGEWIGIRHSDSAVVALKVDKKGYYLLEQGKIDSCTWALNGKSGMLQLSTKDQASLSYYVLFPTFDSLLLGRTPFSKVDSLPQRNVVYSFERADEKAWRAQVQGVKP